MAEVSQRPLVNMYRRTLDNHWRQIYLHIAGVELPEPSHDTLIVAREAGLDAPEEKS